MSARAGFVLVGALAFAVAGLCLLADLPALTGGRFWSDGATYYTMAWSLAEDGDVRFEARDLLRVRREYASGPEGIFLKRASGGLTADVGAGFPWVRRVGPGEGRLYLAKPFVYAAAAAPLVRLLGSRGLLLTNALCLGLVLLLGYDELRRRMQPGRAVAVSVVMVLGTVAPVYLVWLHPELLNVALLMAGLWAWRRERPVLSAVLFGIAAYSKPYSVFVAVPLCCEPLLTGGPLLVRVLEGSRRGVILLATTALLFGLNVAATGEWNYQGGERKTFHGHFPFEAPDASFGRLGEWMTTDQLGPLVEGQDEAKKTRRTGPLRAPGEIDASFVRNLAYFWVGRYAGALPYYPPVVVALVLFLAAGPRDRAGALALLALLISYLFYIRMIPDNWYGGGGTLGNRYFLNLLPLGFFLVPRGREWWVAAGGLAGAAVFLAGVLTSPVAHSLRPGDHAMVGLYRRLPAELTMLNDLTFCTEAWRKKVSFGDTEGDAWRGWPADPKAYYLYFPDAGTWGKEELAGRQGFWLRGGERAEVILRALEPVKRMTFSLTGGPVGDDVRVWARGSPERALLRPGETHEIALDPGTGFPYYDSFLYVLRFESTRSPSSGERLLGAFVVTRLEVDKRSKR